MSDAGNLESSGLLTSFVHEKGEGRRILPACMVGEIADCFYLYLGFFGL